MKVIFIQVENFGLSKRYVGYATALREGNIGSASINTVVHAGYTYGT